MFAPRLFSGLLAAAVIGGGWCFFRYFELEFHRGPQGLDYVKIKPRGGPPSSVEGSTDVPTAPVRPTIRIATFDLSRLDDQKLASRPVSDALVKAVTQFDLVAVQDVRARNQGALVRLVERIDAIGRHYDFAVCPTVVRDNVEQYSAFLFDRATLEVDRSTVCSVKDTAGRFRHKPLVAAFRVRGPAPREAFTFTLINVQIDRDRVAAELDLLRDVYRAVRDDGRKEDDVILLGDLGTDPEHFGALGQILNITWAITSTPTTTRGTALVDNILFDRQATVEFTGRSGVLDLMRELGLSTAEALEVSEHLPVWAEFSAFEGGQAGHVATAPDAGTR